MDQKGEVQDKVALLAPVPLCHLESAMSIIAETGKVSVGSMAFEVFRELDLRTKEQEIEVYIYASHAEATTLPQATWHGRYVRSVDSKLGRHPDGEETRPPSTRHEDRPGPDAWACFWEVADLLKLPGEDIVPTHEFFGFGKPKPYKKGFIPQGPLIVHIP
jgi:hypothetical protein